ncbi:MAG: hypothetical protein Q4C30_10355 [Bacteroidia bacterium]|nr:hypothetical protein [Bacteroidia bacterium]
MDENTKKQYTFEKVVRKSPYDYIHLPRNVCYRLPNFTPLVGRTYTAKVIYEGNEYMSTQTVHQAPIVEKVTFKPYSTIDESRGLFRPFLYISDPNPSMPNYYLFVNDLSRYYFSRDGYESHYMPLSLLTDYGMNNIYGGVEMSLGMGCVDSQKGTGVGSEFDFEVMSISKENYDFFVEMEKQITTDGGVYTPCPVTPPTNFSGERVMGQFIATDAKNYHFKATDDNIEK